MRIAFAFEPSAQWQAGIVTLEALLQAITSSRDARPALTLVVGPHTPEAEYQALTPFVDQVLRTPRSGPPQPVPAAPQPPRWRYFHRKLLRRLGLRRPLTAAAPASAVQFSDDRIAQLRRHQVDCLFAGAYHEQSTQSFPFLTWIYDFQHRALPDLFPASERRHRDELFRREAEAATLVMVKSQAVRRDFLAFAPDCAGKVRVIPWVLPIAAHIYQDPLNELLDTYHLPEKFFYLPNQFWIHKNHDLVVEALHILRGRGVRPVVVCTGGLAEARAPQHFALLSEKISRLGLREQFIYLGLVRRDEVFGLMRQSISLLNPSQFEGFGLSVAECVSLGKRALLSDIPAHREHEHPQALYFNPQDPHQLARHMEQVWNSALAGPDLALEAWARHALPERQQGFAQAFVHMAQEAVELWQSNHAPDPSARQMRWTT